MIFLMMVFCFPWVWPLALQKKPATEKEISPSRKQNFIKISTLKIVPKTYVLESLVIMNQIGLVWSLSSH
jgi:hypothetical protein